MKIWNNSILVALFTCIVIGLTHNNFVRAEMETKEATFAGGCFWCMEKPFEQLEGVLEVVSGYSGGEEVNPTYQDVASGATGHAEVVQVTYDPSKVTYEKLLDIYWKNIDPTTPNRQFCDVGSQYRTAIFYHNEAQEKLARAWKKKLEDSKKFPQVATEIKKFSAFYPAEDYHQNYYKKNPIRYKMYRMGCGRDARLKELWGDSE